MSLLGRLLGAASTPPVQQRPQRPADSRWRNVKVVGESFYQEGLWIACGANRDGKSIAIECIATLVLEPENTHDKNAIRVEVKGQQCGYLPRGVARLYNKRLREMAAAGQPAICDAFIGGLVEGSLNPNLGISLRFPVGEDGKYEIRQGGNANARRYYSSR